MSSVGIVYGSASGSLRRVIIPDVDAQLQIVHARAMMPGEAMMTVDRKTVSRGQKIDLDLVRSALEAFTGKAVPDPRCAVVNDAGTVEAVVCADPDIDLMPGKTLMRDAAADVGWTLTNGVLSSPTVI